MKKYEFFWSEIPDPNRIMDRRKAIMSDMLDRSNDSRIDQVLHWEDPLVESSWVGLALESVARGYTIPIDYIRGRI